MRRLASKAPLARLPQPCPQPEQLLQTAVQGQGYSSEVSPHCMTYHDHCFMSWWNLEHPSLSFFGWYWPKFLGLLFILEWISIWWEDIVVLTKQNIFRRESIWSARRPNSHRLIFCTIHRNGTLRQGRIAVMWVLGLTIDAFRGSAIGTCLLRRFNWLNALLWAASRLCMVRYIQVKFILRRIGLLNWFKCDWIDTIYIVISRVRCFLPQ